MSARRHVLIIHQHAVSDHFTTAARVEPDDPRTDPLLVDVRGAPETATGTLPGAIEIPLAVLADSLDALDRDRPVVVYCASGYRSVVASSVLVQAGFADVSDLLGGFGAWQSAGLPVARPGDLADLRHAPQVSARTARSLLDAGAALLAVREPGEWYDGHVPGAIPMPMGEVQSRRGELPAATRIVVVCRSGGRSAAIAAALCTQGFDAVNLTGGMCAWQAAGFPVVTRPAVPALEPGEAHRQAAEHGMVVHRDDPLNVETSISALIGGVVMPNARFHVRNHFRTPAIDTGTWTLEITGLVERPLALSLRDLSRLPSETRLVTLECAGNGRSAFNPPVGGEAWRLGAVSTAEWTGVPLDHVLDRVGVLPAATEVVFRGADHGAIEGRPGTIYFERSLSVETARGAQALLAYVMNGERVPMQHGYPLRLVVPSRYGVASVKWLTAIELAGQSFSGYFQADKYWYEPAAGTREPVTLQRVRALITDPACGEEIPHGEITVRGVAWSGVAPIARVEVMINQGPWQQSRLIRDRRRHCWQWWELLTSLSLPGQTYIRARATDQAGRTQPGTAGWNRDGYGNNSVQEVLVTAMEATSP